MKAIQQHKSAKFEAQRERLGVVEAIIINCDSDTDKQPNLEKVVDEMTLLKQENNRQASAI